MKLVVVHHHFRPGGVRRVVELATPSVVRALQPAVTEVLIAAAEPPDEAWQRTFTRALAPVPLACQVEPALGYVAEQALTPVARVRRLRRFFRALLRDATAHNCVVWVHNPGLGRNLALGRELATACAALGVPLVFHHHDWWFDNRWRRWSEMRRSGFRTLRAVANAILPAEPTVRHAAINQADTRVLRTHFPGRTAWWPNPADATPRPSTAAARRARQWLTSELGDRGPVWLVPCRLLRRKNLAEALLLTRWLRPEAWLVTTGGLSSADEEPYARHLAAAAQAAGWRLRLSVLARGESGKPAVPELLAASEAVLLTSIQEGFGLPYLEAVGARRPLLARSLPNIAPDLARFGFRFPHLYDEVHIDPGLLDGRAERARQQRRFETWRRQLPTPCRALAAPPALLSAAAWSQPVPFSRLTLAGQLEVLSRPPAESWNRCAPLNPFLPRWRTLAAQGALAATPWPASADRWLGGPAYARRFLQLLAAKSIVETAAPVALAAQHAFIRGKLHAGNLYPLTWTTRP